MHSPFYCNGVRRYATPCVNQFAHPKLFWAQDTVKYTCKQVFGEGLQVSETTWNGFWKSKTSNNSKNILPDMVTSSSAKHRWNYPQPRLIMIPKQFSSIRIVNWRMLFIQRQTEQRDTHHRLALHCQSQTQSTAPLSQHSLSQACMIFKTNNNRNHAR